MSPWLNEDNNGLMNWKALKEKNHSNASRRQTEHWNQIKSLAPFYKPLSSILCLPLSLIFFIKQLRKLFSTLLSSTLGSLLNWVIWSLHAIVWAWMDERMNVLRVAMLTYLFTHPTQQHEYWTICLNLISRYIDTFTY